MNTIVRLVITYFSGVPALRWIATTALLLIGPVTYGVIVHRQIFEAPYENGIPVVLMVLVWLAFLGVFAGFFIGAGLMPVMVGRFAVSHQIYVLPHGRLKVLASALATVVLVSLSGPIVVTAALWNLPVLADEPIFAMTFIANFFVFSVIYMVFWFVSRSRTTMGLLGGSMATVLSLIFATWLLQRPQSPLLWPISLSVLLWVALAASFLFAPRLKKAISGLRAHASRMSSAIPSTEGREVDLLIGTARPWLLALGQVFPILVATPLFFIPQAWLFYLTLVSAISGAITSFAASRSRALWLRTNMSRVELFARIEAAFWRHNGYALVVLLLLFLTAGIYLEIATVTIALGVPLLILGTLVSTYLGLFVTKGIGWFESCIAILAMVLLMGVAVFATDSPVDVATAVTLEAVLAGLAIVLRTLAKHRWTGLDWTLCRPELVTRAS